MATCPITPIRRGRRLGLASERPRATAELVLVLVLALVLECAGALAIAVREGGTFQQVGTALALGASLFVALRGESRAAYVVAAWFATAAVLKTVAGTEPFSALALPAHATRYGLALAIAQPRFAIPILRVATSLTFIGHGIEALGQHPKFIAYIQHTGELVGVRISDGITASLLRLIGAIDLVLAAMVFLRLPRRLAAGYMTVWGCITALARTVYAGPAGIPDTLIRAANMCAPLALFFLWREPPASSLAMQPRARPGVGEPP